MLINSNNLTIYDISMAVHHDMPVWKGREQKKPVFRTESDFSTGKVYETLAEINMHTGTHLDRQLHMIPGGNTVDTLELGKVITGCKVIDCTDADRKIAREDLENKGIQVGDFVLLKTKNSFLDILEQDFIWLDGSGAEYLRSLKIKGVGIDALGIENNQPEHETHMILLGSDILILEGLRLQDIEEGEYLLLAAPINIIGAEAAPVRAVLIR